jgi:hypothetical protein
MWNELPFKESKSMPPVAAPSGPEVIQMTVSDAPPPRDRRFLIAFHAAFEFFAPFLIAMNLKEGLVALAPGAFQVRRGALVFVDTEFLDGGATALYRDELAELTKAIEIFEIRGLRPHIRTHRGLHGREHRPDTSKAELKFAGRRCASRQ